MLIFCLSVFMCICLCSISFFLKNGGNIEMNDLGSHRWVVTHPIKIHMQLVCTMVSLMHGLNLTVLKPVEFN